MNSNKKIQLINWHFNFKKNNFPKLLNLNLLSVLDQQLMAKISIDISAYF